MNANFCKAASLPAPEAVALAHSEALCAYIQKQLELAGGWLPFDRYMELALYTPGLGYYSGGSAKFGRTAEDGSDFITAPELSPLFAQALARAVGEALQASGTNQLMEFGAGTGKLAAQLLLALADLGIPCERYTIVEVSGTLRAQQQATLAQYAPNWIARVQWIDALPETFAGVALGNEVLDAMPVQLFARLNGSWFERGVTYRSSQSSENTQHTIEAPLAFGERLVADSPLLNALRETVPGEHDYVTETHAAAIAFVQTVCRMLTRGALLLIDYGFPRHEYYHPQRASGTLMCHYRHRAHADPFFYPGLQDITSHVEFSSLAEAAIKTGADLLGYTSQARFLLNCGILELLQQLDPQDTQRFLPAANAVQKLLAEAEMGELFKVIGFGRGMPDGLTAFSSGDRSATL